ncbi:MAG: CAP domain-containing protein [Oscillospiraceae bacterium]|nr:CAP domain-containing protein [Oscillospiraceae bacterium]
MNRKLAAILAFCMLLFAVSTVLIIVSNGKHRQATVSDDTLNPSTSEDSSSADTSSKATDLSQTSVTNGPDTSDSSSVFNSEQSTDTHSVPSGSVISSTGDSHSSAVVHSQDTQKQENEQVHITTSKTMTYNQPVQTKPQTQQTQLQTQVQTRPQTQPHTKPETQFQTKPQTQQSPTTEPVQSEAPPQQNQQQDNGYANEVLELVNKARSDNGLSALSLDTTLCSAALVRSTETVSVFSHTRPDGSSCFTVLDEFGINARTKGENIAWGQKSSQEVMTAWMNSEGHRANILNSSFTTLGVGVYNSGGRLYWTQLFTG